MPHQIAGSTPRFPLGGAGLKLIGQGGGAGTKRKMLQPKMRQTRCALETGKPEARAITRELQCVALEGVVFGGRDGFQGLHDRRFDPRVGDRARRSRRGSSCRPSTHLAKNRRRHLPTAARIATAAACVQPWPGSDPKSRILKRTLESAHSYVRRFKQQVRKFLCALHKRFSVAATGRRRSRTSAPLARLGMVLSARQRVARRALALPGDHLDRVFRPEEGAR